ncbi:MAG: hypothetical protein HQ522_21375 [Bacteroidetes bacterium]|nr:hypothetical protein [Bacteroidota bacterium]
MMVRLLKHIVFPLLLILFLGTGITKATDISDKTFLITELSSQNFNNERLWAFLQGNNSSGIKIKINSINGNTFLNGSTTELSTALKKIQTITKEDQSKIIPVFLSYNDNVLLLDSIIKNSDISKEIFYLPRGETWPSVEYLVQANRRIVLFIEGDFENESRILHDTRNYVLQISANQLASTSTIHSNHSNLNLELFMVKDFDHLPTIIQPNMDSRNLAPDYINFLLENWKKYGKKPNFIFIGEDIFIFDFIIDQLNSFSMIKGRVRISGKNLEKVYWKNPDVSITGGRFSFPFRGGEEVILSPYAPGFKMSPEQIIVTGEMEIPENHSILATPLELSEKMTSKFEFDGILIDALNPTQTFSGDNFSFSQDIERGNVLRLPEKARVNLGDPEIYGLRNSSFTVSCFVKFTDILEFGDNAIIGNLETGYRKGMHLILRSGHPYFGLWANDFISNETLIPNVWYHLAWRYIIQTGEQSILLNGKNIGISDGHPPFSGTGDIQLGSALSSGASLRGYIDNLYIWNRPLGNEEINRLYLDEEIQFKEIKISENPIISFSEKWFFIIIGITLLLVLGFIFNRYFRKKQSSSNYVLPVPASRNQILLFGEFKAIDNNENYIPELFTPKVKELFLFILIYTLKNGIGANASEINEKLWPGIPSNKVANNRSVTLNKLRRILLQFEGMEIIATNGYLQAKIEESFFCDYVEAFNLCQIPEGMSKKQLVSFFLLVKRGRFLKGITWNWLDDIRGFTGNQVIDNLLKLATIHKKENNLKEVANVAQRILDYDDLNEEAIYLQIWALKEANNIHLAKFNFKSYCTKYQDIMGEPLAMDFEQFLLFYKDQFSA